MSKAFEIAKEIFLQHNGFLRSAEARRLGIHPQTLSRMLEAGLLVKEERGLYRFVEIQLTGNADLIQVAKLVPDGVICLLSALTFHNMTTQIPRRVYLALRQDMKKPRFQYPSLEVVWMSGSSYSAGIERRELDGVAVPIYDREKTVADCFKFRNKIGLDVAIEALEEYLRQTDRSIDMLLRYSRIDRVRNVIDPYIKALT